MQTSGAKESIPALQQCIQGEIATHAAQVQRLGLGSATAIQDDIETTIARVWRRMQATERAENHARRCVAIDCSTTGVCTWLVVCPMSVGSP
jgi:hypothetical protein